MISRMAEGAGITKAQAEKAMDGVLEAVKEGLKDGGKVVLQDLARFHWQPEKPGRAGIPGQGRL